MLKMVIEFDEEKAGRDAVPLETLYNHIDERFERRGLQKYENGIYVDKGNEDDLMQFMVMAGALKKAEWFIKYIKQWLWYEESDEPEDLIKVFKLGS